MDQVSDIVTLEMIDAVISTCIKCICIPFSPAEKGQFLALDLGGSKFKVLQVKVREDMGIRRGGVEMDEKTYPMPEELLTGRGTEVRRREQGHSSGWWSCSVLTFFLSNLLFSPCSSLTMWQSL